ncbi:hypothetical protein MMC21_005205 [Puttea exsequens]|nr:hypothetical protein [Puttea exsequens]
MQLTSLVLVTALSYFPLISNSFPVKPQEPASPTLRKRAAYSVVAVDGGAAATAAPTLDNAPLPQAAAATLIQTIEQTETVAGPVVTVPPSIETVVTTKVVTDNEPAKTIQVVVTQAVNHAEVNPSKEIYKVVDVENNIPPPPPKATTTTTASTTIKCISTKSTVTPLAINATPPSIAPTTSSSTSPISPPFAPKIAIPSMELKAPVRAGWSPPAGLLPPPSSSSASSIPLPTATAYTSQWQQQTTTTKTFDDGMWHTTYPAWNAGSTGTSSSAATAAITGQAYQAWRRG